MVCSTNWFEKHKYFLVLLADEEVGNADIRYHASWYLPLHMMYDGDHIKKKNHKDVLVQDMAYIFLEQQCYR